MLPTTLVTLIEPDSTEHEIWATVVFVGGRDDEIESAIAGQWRTRFEFRWDLQDRLIDDGWRIVDSLGRTFDIESAEKPSGKRARERIIIVMARRTQ